MMKLIISGRLDGLNKYIDDCRANTYKGNKTKRRNQDICSWEIKKQLRGVRIDGKVKLHFKWFEKNKKRDLDNISSFGRKVIQDALVECGVIKDDGWDYVKGFTDEFHIDKKNPRIEVEIEVVE